MHYKVENKLNNLWLKASALGSLWAANEIVLGSFLHNIRLPMSGTIMSFFSVVFILAFISRWPQKGLIIRAGIIAALMKSISPSAIILGPMMGIIIEAIILELFFRISKGRLLIMIIGGGFAVSEVLFQKVLTLLVSFGWDIMLMLDALYGFVARQLGSINVEGYWSVIVLFSIYFVTGIIATLIGRRAGKLSFKLEKEIAAVPIFEQKKNNSIFGDEIDEKYSGILLITHFISLIAGMFIIKNTDWYIGLAVVLAYFFFIAFRYKNAFNHLKKPTFWVLFFIISILAGLLFSQEENGSFFSFQGFFIGMKMNIRAALVVISFAAIGKELKSPIIKAILYKSGLQNFYRALSLAFGILPESIKAFPPAKEMFRSPIVLVSKLLIYAENLIKELERRDKLLLPIIIISGNIQEGKTTFVHKVVNRLQRKDINVQGFYSEVVYIGDQRQGYELKNINSSKKITLCNINYKEDWDKQGKFYFNAEAVDYGNNILQKINNTADLIVIDEIGPFEIKGKGWAKSINQICNNSTSPMLWVVRDSLVNKISRRWPVGKIYHFKLSNDLPAQDVENIALKMINEWKHSQKSGN